MKKTLIYLLFAIIVSLTLWHCGVKGPPQPPLQENMSKIIDSQEQKVKDQEKN